MPGYRVRAGAGSGRRRTQTLKRKCIGNPALLLAIASWQRLSYPLSYPLFMLQATAASLASARRSVTATSTREPSPLIIAMRRSTLMRRKSALRTRE